jgi:hypothetical protein
MRPDTYIWNGNAPFAEITFTPAATAIYSVTATTSATNNAFSCSATKTIEVVVLPTPVITAVSQKTLICRGEKATLTGGGASSYTWSTGSNNSTVSVSPVNLTLYTYTLTGADANGCSGSTTIKIIVSACNEINDKIQNKAALSVFPNPSNGDFKVYSDKEINLNIVDSQGKLIRKISIDESNIGTCFVKDLPVGVYYLLAEGNDIKQGIKIIVTK